METYITILLVCAAIIIFIIVFSIIQTRNSVKRLEERLKKEFGNVPNHDYEYEKFESIAYYSKKIKDERVSSGRFCDIDDITWHDLDMDSVFLLMDSTQSSVGEEYLYSMLRTPALDQSILDERERLITLFSENEDKRIKLQKGMSVSGELPKISVYEYVDRLENIQTESNYSHYLKLFLFIASFCLIFIKVDLGIILTIIMFFVNVISYFKRKGEIEKYYSVVAYMLRVIDSTKIITSLDIPEISTYQAKLKELYNNYSKITKGGRMIVCKSNSGDIFETVFDYLRMATHIDLIKFNNMLVKLKEHRNWFNDIFEIIGFLDAMSAIASFRKLMITWCKPVLHEDGNNKLNFTADNIYHPLIAVPVTNSISETRSVLLTGSNASGKSTFIKTVAINSILAQSINTCMADRYEASFYKTMSSMALSDNLSEGESYYIVEIKSLKRICDSLNDDVPLLVFIDEVLRGTNTLERVSASSQILNYISKRNCLLFAATHDIELTRLLADGFSMYHFEEHVEDKDVLFDYILKKGPAITKNAIKLLNMLGFDKSIIEKATEQAEIFSDKGEWELV